MTNQEALHKLEVARDLYAWNAEDLEVLNLAIEALQKQEPVQIRKFGDGTSKCPICRNWLKEDMDFCDKCGQAISWRTDDEPYR